MSEASYQKKLDYTKEYEKENYRKVMLRIKTKEDKDIIDYLLTKDSINQYVISLIRADLESTKKQGVK